jgi:accessory gene regulator protein AgrB
VCTIFIVSSFIVRNNFLCNSLLLSIFTEALMICPFTYKIFGVSYNNYLAYNVNI